MTENSGTGMSEEPVPRAHAEQGRAIRRVFDAPRELVWKAWTEPERLKCWWGPSGYTAPVARIDLRAGGTYLWGMRSPDGQDIFTTGVYRESARPERFVVTEQFADADGNVVPASYYGMSGDWPSEIVMTVTFEEHDGRTAMTVREGGVPDEMRSLSDQGMNESLDKLAACLARVGPS